MIVNPLIRFYNRSKSIWFEPFLNLTEKPIGDFLVEAQILKFS